MHPLTLNFGRQATLDEHAQAKRVYQAQTNQPPRNFSNETHFAYPITHDDLTSIVTTRPSVLDRWTSRLFSLLGKRQATNPLAETRLRQEIGKDLDTLQQYLAQQSSPGTTQQATPINIVFELQLPAMHKADLDKPMVQLVASTLMAQLGEGTFLANTRDVSLLHDQKNRTLYLRFQYFNRDQEVERQMRIYNEQRETLMGQLQQAHVARRKRVLEALLDRLPSKMAQRLRDGLGDM